MKSGQHKLSDFDVKTIFESSTAQKTLAEHYGIGVSMVSKIKCRIAYVNVTSGLVRGGAKSHQLPIKFPKRILL